MRCTSLSVLSSVLLLCAAAPVEGQQRETGTITGVITETTLGTPVVGARVSVTGTTRRPQCRVTGE